jgi:hypothetical protein
MDYCLGDQGAATMWSGPPDVDLDGDGTPEAIGLDFDGDGLRDDALADLDGDGVADHAVLDVGAGRRWFTDDGTGTWSTPAERAGAGSARSLRWFSLDGGPESGSDVTDFDADGVEDRLFDTDGDGLADRVLCGDGSGYPRGYVDVDGDGRWDITLVDHDGDGAADDARTL